jgi:hypothetical protein
LSNGEDYDLKKCLEESYFTAMTFNRLKELSRDPERKNGEEDMAVKIIKATSWHVYV